MKFFDVSFDGIATCQHPWVTNCKGASVIVELIKKRQNAEAEQDDDAPTEEAPKVFFSFTSLNC